jgi:hypothetical protein
MPPFPDMPAPEPAAPLAPPLPPLAPLAPPKPLLPPMPAPLLPPVAPPPLAPAPCPPPDPEPGVSSDPQLAASVQARAPNTDMSRMEWLDLCSFMTLSSRGTLELTTFTLFIHLINGEASARCTPACVGNETFCRRS